MLCLDRSPDVDLTDDDEGQDEAEDWSNDELSDSDQPLHDDETRTRSRSRKSGRGAFRQAAINRVSLHLLDFGHWFQISK